MSIEQYITYADGVTWKATLLMQNAGNDIVRRDAAVTEISAMLAKHPSEYIKSEYIKNLSKSLGITRKELQNRVSNAGDTTTTADESDRVHKLPESVSEEFVGEWGFYGLNDGPKKTGYWFDQGREKRFLNVSNFLATPLFHLYSVNKEMNKRMMEINNGYVSRTIEIPSRSMISLDSFIGMAMEEGNFIFSGSRTHLLRLNEYWGDKFPMCFELMNLGWQDEGFFAYSDQVFNGDLMPYNEYGIVQHHEQHYYSPGANKKRSQRRLDGSKFDADHQLRYSPAPVTWEQWAAQMKKVYPEHYMMAISSVCMALCRDLVLKFSNNFPLGYCYGERQSGKSEFVLSIMNLFVNDAKMFNLNSGTDAAFFTYVSRFKNCVVGLNEFDDKDIRPEWFQAIKGFYDVEGRKRNKDKYSMEEQPVNCMAVLAGQYLSTRDDNSITSRSLLCQFMAKPNRTKEEMGDFQQLVDWQKQGLNGILTEILAKRFETLAESNLKDMFDDTLAELRAEVKERELRWEDRVGRNYALMITFLRWANENWQMPYKLYEAKQYALGRMMDVVNIMTTTDVLMEWWNTMMRMADAGVLREGWHYKITHASEQKIKHRTGKEIVLGADVPRMVLMMRLNICHGEYMKEYGKVSKTVMNQTSLVNYFKNREYWLGNKEQEWFSSKDPKSGKLQKTHTSVYVFDYDMLLKMGVNMQYDMDVPEEYKTAEVPAMKADKELPF